MALTAARDRRGELTEPSIVRRRTARLFFGVPNGAAGLAYYLAFAAAFPLGASPAVRLGVSAAALLAAAVSVRLIVDLAFAAPAGCSNCWVAHACNLTLVVLAATLWA